MHVDELGHEAPKTGTLQTLLNVAVASRGLYTNLWTFRDVVSHLVCQVDLETLYMSIQHQQTPTIVGGYGQNIDIDY